MSNTLKMAGEAVLKSACKLVAGRDYLEEARCSVSIRQDGHLGKVEMPRAAMRWSSADGQPPTGKFRSLLVGVNRGEHFVYIGRVGTGYGGDKVRHFSCPLEIGGGSQVAIHRGWGSEDRMPLSIGPSRSLSPRLNLPAGPAAAISVRPSFKGLERRQTREGSRSQSVPPTAEKTELVRAPICVASEETCEDNPLSWASSSPSLTRRCGPMPETAAGDQA